MEFPAQKKSFDQKIFENIWETLIKTIKNIALKNKENQYKKLKKAMD